MPQGRKAKRRWDKKIERATRFKEDREPKLKSFMPKKGEVEMIETYGNVVSNAY